MKALIYTLFFTILTSSFVSCSKSDLSEDEIQVETIATEGDDEKSDDKPEG